MASVQVIVTTHVPALAGLLPTSGVLFLEKIDGALQISSGTDEVLDRVVRTLGVLPQREVAGAQALILVEGNSDVTFLRHSSEVLKSNGNLSHSLADKRIVPVPTGGCGNLNHWVTKKIADELGLPWGVLMDSDQDGTNPPEFLKNQQIISDLVHSGKQAHLTRKREPENYIALCVVRSAVDTPQTVALNYSDFDDAKKAINAATGTGQTQVLTTYWPLMTAADILATAQYQDGGQTRNEIVDMLQSFLGLV